MRAAYLAGIGGVSGAKRRGLAALAGLGLLLAPLAASASGPLYRYVDRRGVIHFTNVQWDSRYDRVTDLRTIRPALRARAPQAHTYDPLVLRVGRDVGIPPALVKAVIAAESAFDPHAVSHKGAMGLMQLMPKTARSLGVRRPFEAEQNVHGGARYLRGLHEQYGSWTKALAAYNAGPAAVDRFGGIPPYRETQTYVRRVLNYYRQYHRQLAQ
jgi:soluble lytic murein transglycosylase